ncbi:HVO_2072 family ArtA-dependent S-layer glycoprotein [Haloarculaceae archaeon H-GB11]|nr:HVO_2072 family ArtA-dependent S-layer glycoprotein [Haloarculaceae archaeon H-GB11]
MVVLIAISSVSIGMVYAINADRGGDDEGEFNPGVGGPSNIVVDTSKPVVFQGEDDINLVNQQGNSVDASNLVGVSGDAEGVPLETPIPQDQQLGQYAVNGQASQVGVTVQTPRVTDLEVINERGIDVEGASVQEDETLLVRAEWNYEEAEDLEIVVRDQNGNEVTGDVLTNANALSDAQRDELSGPYAQSPEVIAPNRQRGTGTGVVYLQGVGQFNDSQLQNEATVDAAYWALDLSDQESGDYTITVEGWDNLDFGSATRTTTVSSTSETDVTLDLGSDNATRGQRVPFTVRGSTAGANHFVVIEDDDFRNNNVDTRVFPDVQDVVDTGTYDTNDDGNAEFAWAQVEINDETGVGVGQIDTAFLDDASVTVDLFQADRALDDVANNLGNNEDEETLDVQQGELVFESPAGTYVAGQDIDVRGTAAEGTDDVAIYARDQGDWELVDINTDGEFNSEDTISVDADGEWEREDVTLSDASDILSIPGRYRVGVVEVEDVVDSQGNISETLTTSEFSTATSSQTSIIVQDPGLETGQSFETINGQIAVEDGTVNVRGVAPGLNEVLVVMVDSRGRIATDQVTVDDDDTFEEDDIPLVTANNRELNEGNIRAVILGVGRDGVAGDGILPGQTRADIGALEDYILSIGTGLTQDQAVERIFDETTDEAGSDDLVLDEEFRYTDGAISIESVQAAGDEADGVQQIEVGEEMVVSGKTNRQPDDNTITVEVIDGPSPDQFETNSTDEWDLDGNWSVSLGTDGVEPGTYTIEADDGDNTDTVQVEIVEPSTETATPEPTTTTTIETNETTTTSEATATATPESTATATVTPETNESS